MPTLKRRTITRSARYCCRQGLSSSDSFELGERKDDDVVTKNGCADMHYLEESACRLMPEETAKGHLLSRAALAEEELAAGKETDLDELIASLRADQGLE